MRLRQYYDVGFEEVIYYVEDRVFYFNFLQDNRAIIRIFPMEDYYKIDLDIKMKEYKYGIIYIRETDEFQMQEELSKNKERLEITNKKSLELDNKSN